MTKNQERGWKKGDLETKNKKNKRSITEKHEKRRKEPMKIQRVRRKTADFWKGDAENAPKKENQCDFADRMNQIDPQ